MKSRFGKHQLDGQRRIANGELELDETIGTLPANPDLAADGTEVRG